MLDIDVLDTLIQHFGADNVKDHGDYAKIKCPMHKNGQERTPSCKVNIKEPFLGRFICWACGATGSLNELLGLDEDANFSSFHVHVNRDLMRKKPKKEIIKSWKDWKRWPKSKEWRDIPGWLVRDMQGRIEITDYGKQLALPVIQHGKCQGLIHCSLKKKRLSYIYDKHPYIKTCLFAHDYAESMLRKSKRKRLMYAEGPRDTLRPISFGIPTVGNMGGVTVWTKEKADLIRFLNPSELVIATDPDKIGNQLAEKIRDELTDIKCRRLKLKIKYDDEGNVIYKEDPGCMTELRLLKLARYFE